MAEGTPHDVTQLLMDCLAKTRSGIKSNLILNSVVHLRDGKPGYKFEISASSLNPELKPSAEAMRRLEYLDPDTAASSKTQTPSKRKRK